MPIPWEAASRGLQNALANSGLVAESSRAAADGLEFVMPVGPRGGDHLAAHDVRVQIRSMSSREHTLVAALRWDPSGPSRHVLPSLDGNLTLADAGPEGSLLSIVAAYRPPLGIVGTVVDRAVMSRVATATMKALLREISEKLQLLASDDGPTSG